MSVYERPGAGVYVTASKTTPHAAPATEDGLVGIAIKQQPHHWYEGLIDPESIAIGEAFHLRTKGIKQVDVSTGSSGVAVAAGTMGQGVYIRPADNTLHLAGATNAGDLPFGRIVESNTATPNRGVDPNHVRIDLDQRIGLPLV